MNEERKVPRLRFEGFTEAWEQRELGEVAEIKDSARIPNSEWTESGVPYVRASDITNEDINGVLFISEERYKFYKSRTGAPEQGDVLFNGGGEIGKAMLMADNTPIYVQGGAVLYARTSVSTMLYGGYLKQYFETSSVKSYIDSSSAGGTMKHFTLKPSQKMPIMFPTMSEQKKIGQYFSHLDDLITLQQRKLDKLKDLKSAYLSEMFPAEGQCKPRLRFEGFTEAWEQCELGEVAEIVGGGTPGTSVSEYWDGDIDWYAPAEIGNQIFVEHSKKTITELGLQKSSARILPVGTVLFTSRAGIGNTAILAKEGTTNQGFQSIVPNKEELDTYFIYSRSNELKKYGEVTGAGSTFVEVSGKQMAKMELRLPSLKEQSAIGQFFRHLDDLITLQQRKLDKLKDLKSAYLSEMFV